MRVLKAVPGSVLWLLKDNDLAEENLRREAAARGVDPGRLVFAPRISPTEHLARQTLADLFLDTFPCNAHTTASDALWVGLPVLTCSGDSFASRVAASLLNAQGLEDLVCASLEEYEAKAIHLSSSPIPIENVKTRCRRAAESGGSLFDSLATTQAIERGYLQAHHEFTLDIRVHH
jgi:predicted O-linked N-acetylglucosamine transferase (SPINDLY family)